MLIGIGMMSLNIFSGGLLLLNYAGNIFKESGSEIDPNISAIIMISVQLAGTCVASFMVDQFGRRALLISSTTGAAIGLALMGVFNFLITRGFDLASFNWVPVASLSFAVFMTSIGLMPIVFVIVAEVLPQKVF